MRTLRRTFSSRRRIAAAAAAVAVVVSAGGAATAMAVAKPKLDVTGAGIGAGQLTVTGKAPNGATVSIDGTDLQTKATQKGTFRFAITDWRPADCKLTVTAGGSSASAVVAGCGLAGPTGKDGKDGADGQDGAPGETGARGPQGEQGLQGLQGAQGPQGDEGPQGEPGDPGAEIMSAYVNIDGTLGRANVTGVSSNVSVSIYTVTFPHAVDTCTFTATPLNNLNLVATQVLTVSGTDVAVGTTNISSHGLTQSAFYLTAFC